MSCLKELIQKICGAEKDDEVLKCLQTLLAKENNDLPKAIIDSCTKIKLKELENELEKKKNSNNMLVQIGKFILIGMVTFIFAKYLKVW